MLINLINLSDKEQFHCGIELHIMGHDLNEKLKKVC